jgi:hypothetical protein
MALRAQTPSLRARQASPTVDFGECWPRPSGFWTGSGLGGYDGARRERVIIR